MGKCLSHCIGADCSASNGHMGSTSLGKQVSPHTSQDFAPCYSEAQVLRLKIEPSSMTTGGSTSGDVNTPRDIRLSVHSCSIYQNGDRPSSLTHNRKLSASKNQKNGSSELIAKSADDVVDLKLHAFFDQYKDSNDDSILEDGIERLCADLGVRPDEFRVLVLAWKFQAETMCRFTRAEFVGGCRALGVCDVAGVESKFTDMTDEMKNKDAFKDMYRWSYRFALDSDCGQRTLPLDMAISMWGLVFSQSKPPMLARWLEFLEGNRCVRGITKDTWDMFLNFLESVSEDFSGYDDTEAWPSLFDYFVEWAVDHQQKERALPIE